MKHQWMTAEPAKYYFGKWKEATQLSMDKKADNPEIPPCLASNIPPSRIPYSRRAKQYRIAILKKQGRSVLHMLSDRLESSRKITGYITLGTFIDKPAISALTHRDGESLALLIAPINHKQLTKISALKNKKKQAAQLATQNSSIQDVSKIKQQITATIRISTDIAVMDSVELFTHNSEINPGAFLYPVYISHGESPENIAHMTQTALNDYDRQCLIPVFTSINTESQAALDLYMAALLNQGVEQTLTNFNKLTQARYGLSGRTNDRLLTLLKGVKIDGESKNIFSLLSVSSQRAVNTGDFEQLSEDELARLPESIKAELNLTLKIKQVRHIRQSIANAYQKETSRTVNKFTKKRTLYLKTIDLLTRKLTQLSEYEALLRKENRLLRIALSGYIAQIKKKKLPIEEKKVRIIRQRSKINRLIVKRQRAIGKLMYKSQILLKKRHALVSHPAYLKAKHGITA